MSELHSKRVDPVIVSCAGVLCGYGEMFLYSSPKNCLSLLSCDNIIEASDCLHLW